MRVPGSRAMIAFSRKWLSSGKSERSENGTVDVTSGQSLSKVAAGTTAHSKLFTSERNATGMMEFDDSFDVSALTPTERQRMFQIESTSTHASTSS